MAEEEGIAGLYWKKYRNEESTFALFTPFLVCVAAGNLDSDCFRHCISQDYHFLQAFLEAYETVEDYADDDEKKKLIRHLRESIDKMINAHQSTVLQEWGFELPKVSIPDSTTTKYKDFLLATASRKIGVGGEGEGVLPLKRPRRKTPFEKNKVAAYTLAATAPFMRLYQNLCAIIITDLDFNTTPTIFKKWLHYHTYSEEMKDLAQNTEDALNKLSASFTTEDLKITEKIYHQAMKLQVEFFAQQIPKRTVVPLSRVEDPYNSKLTIFSDFDLTCSAVRAHHNLAGYKKFMESIRPRTVPGEVRAFDYDGLCEALKQVAEFEKEANTKVEESAGATMKGLSIDGSKDAGCDLDLQNGCREFFQKILKKKYPRIDVHVNSYNWCGDLIRSALSSDQKAMNIHPNKLVYEANPLEKLDAFMKVLEGHKISSSSEGKHLKIYIGGGVGDFSCLVEADIGIVFGSSDSLRILGEHFGVSFVPLLQGVVKKQMGLTHWKPRCGILYTVESWAEIQAFILGS
ncbi:heme oxygenase [Trema orientale]|uniref:Heme oxygenase n=1 Tax=Trema orientale TaxID=63057 RepID=A0A2P5C0K7_TREOI|nr:heme oxygenase [Trema orientale]